MEYIDSNRTHLLKTEDADRAWSFCGRVFDLDMIQPVKHYFKQTCSVCQAAYEAQENEIATRRQMQEQEDRERLKAWNAAASSFTPQNNGVQPTIDKLTASLDRCDIIHATTQHDPASGDHSRR